jgi:hypothetical protein
MNGPEGDWNSEVEVDAELAAFEERLAVAMRRVDAPAGFGQAVMQRVEANERSAARILAMPRRWSVPQAWAAGAIAAALLVGVGLQTVHRHQEKSVATRQFDVATQIEQQALEHTREQLSRNGISLDK